MCGYVSNFKCFADLGKLKWHKIQKVWPAYQFCDWCKMSKNSNQSLSAVKKSLFEAEVMKTIFFTVANLQ